MSSRRKKSYSGPLIVPDYVCQEMMKLTFSQLWSLMQDLLPLRLVAGLLAEAGPHVPTDHEALYREKSYPNWARFADD